MADPDRAGAADRLALPEFTRSLRGFASVRSLGMPEHDLIFGPLIAARRSAARVVAAEARTAAFDSERLRRSFREALSTIARERSQGDAARAGPLARALEARMEERGAPVFGALDAIAGAAGALRAASAESRAARWTDWCDAVQALFNAMDGFWLAIDDLAPRGGRGGRTGRASRAILALLTAATLALGAAPLPAMQTSRVVLRVEGVRADSLLAAGFDVVGAEGVAALVVATPRDRDRLAARGARFTEVPVARGALRTADQAAPTVYRSYDDPVRGIRRWVDSLVAANPRVSVDTIGRSFEQRPMLMLKVGPTGDSPQRPNVLFMATYHAREWAATETALRLVQWLAAPPGTDARRDSLVQSRDIYIMPVANPDGYEYTFTTERLWRKTRAPQPGGAIGADMNRNHTVNWALDNQGSSPDPVSEIYRGPAPASEIEVRNIEAFHAAHPPVVSLSYHTFAGLLLYPSGAAYGPLPADLPVYRALAGTHLRSAVNDRVPGSIRTQYAPGPSWSLYTTNGEYVDFASVKHGTIAFTAEVTSGYGPLGFYGFEFADNEAQLEQVFQDNLPFALDLLDAARNPESFRSASTGLGVERIVVESASPEIRVTVPAAAAPTAGISAGAAVTFRIDSGSGGRYTRRLISQPAGRPSAFAVSAGGESASFRLLAFGGAENGDPPWMSQGFDRDSIFRHSGAYAWISVSGSLTTPAVTVPADADTVSLAYWTMHFGTGFTPEPSGAIHLSTDGGASWTPVLIQRNSAPAWYTDRVVVGGVRGKQVQFRFSTNGMVWRIDDAAIVAHGPVTSTNVAADVAVRPSENPVRSGSVRFSWPFGTTPGDMIAFDFAGREVWRSRVTTGESPSWDVAAGRVANGVYLVVARAGKQVSRLKLFVARRAE